MRFSSYSFHSYSSSMVPRSRAHPRHESRHGWIRASQVPSADRPSTEIFCDSAFMNSMKKQKGMTLKTPSGRWESGVLLEKSGEIAPERMKRLSQSGTSAQLWRCLVEKVKSDAVKNDIA